MTESIGIAKILIVEDEVLIAADLASRLKKLGYTICGQAASGEKALELVEKQQPDLVMMDIVLQGGMDGIDAAEVIWDKLGTPVVFPDCPCRYGPTGTCQIDLSFRLSPQTIPRQRSEDYRRHGTVCGEGGCGEKESK